MSAYGVVCWASRERSSSVSCSTRTRSCWWFMCARRAGRAAGAGSVLVAARVTTRARAGVGGVPWTWARFRPGSRPRRLGWPAANMGWSSPRSRGRVTTRATKSMVTELMRIAWRTVGSIITRVWADVDASCDRLEGLRRIGIDEISYKKGHKYLMVVVDHDSRRLVWAAPGRTSATVREFFDLLGEERCAQITHVSADGADFIDTIVEATCPAAIRVADPFHVVKWATEALDEVRRGAWNDARALARPEPKRGRGRPRADAPPRPGSERAKALKGARYSLWKNPENLSDHQQIKLAWIAATDPRLYRAYLLKEGLRVIFQLPYDAAVEALDRWISWARRCRIPSFVKLSKSIVKHKARILAAIEHNLSNGLIESTNTKVRLITRMAFGFKSPEALIALALLSLGGHRPVLPGRK